MTWYIRIVCSSSGVRVESEDATVSKAAFVGAKNVALLQEFHAKEALETAPTSAVRSAESAASVTLGGIASGEEIVWTRPLEMRMSCPC